jgi:hypothetical protein
MSAAAVPTSAQRVSSLTDEGLAVALTNRLRQVVEALPPTAAAVLLAELREVVRAYCRRSPRPEV